MPPQSKFKYLTELVADKNHWHRPLTDEEKALGFLGWHHRGYLPHCDYPGLIQFVTFRLGDSLPQACRDQWEPLLAIESDRERRAKLEEFLDRGLGQCQLKNPHVAQVAESALLHFHGNRYELLAWCVMPNHVHVLVQVWQLPLWKMVRSWKQFVATKAAGILPETLASVRIDEGAHGNEPGRRPAFQTKNVRWQREYWDTFMRSEKQERIAITYIENNPLKARLCHKPDDWSFGSARFRDGCARLILPGNIHTKKGCSI